MHSFVEMCQHQFWAFMCCRESLNDSQSYASSECSTWDVSTTDMRAESSLECLSSVTTVSDDINVTSTPCDSTRDRDQPDFSVESLLVPGMLEFTLSPDCSANTSSSKRQSPQFSASDISGPSHRGGAAGGDAGDIDIGFYSDIEDS